MITGGTGVGKTTFLQWFFQHKLSTASKHKLVLAWCAFRAIECEDAQVHDRTIQAILQKLTDGYYELLGSFTQQKEMYRKDIEAAARGVLSPWAQSQQFDQKLSVWLQERMCHYRDYLEHIIAYLHKDAARTVAIVLDNMDQKAPSLQQKLYHTAQEIATRTAAITIIVLRESTFRQQLRTRLFDAFAHVDYHVKARPIDAILHRRFEYMRKVEGSRKLTIQGAPQIAYQVGIARLLDTLHAAFCSPQALDSAEALQCLANCDIRLQLKLVYRFLISGQTKLAAYLGAYVERKPRAIPYHEFLHSVVLGDRRIFSEDDDAYFMNIFEAGPAVNDSHFTCLRILALYQTRTNQVGDLREQDFLPLSVVVPEFADLGLHRDDLMFHLRRMVRFGLLVSETQESASDPGSEPLALSRCGYYYLSRLYGEFSYFSLMALDTGLSDEGRATKIGDCTRKYLDRAKMPLEARIQASAEFVEYLEECEEREKRSSSIGRHTLFTRFRFVERMKASLENVIAANQPARS